MDLQYQRYSCNQRQHDSVNLLLAGVCRHVARLCRVYVITNNNVHVFCLHYMYTVEHHQRLLAWVHLVSQAKICFYRHINKIVYNNCRNPPTLIDNNNNRDNNKVYLYGVTSPPKFKLLFATLRERITEQNKRKLIFTYVYNKKERIENK